MEKDDVREDELINRMPTSLRGLDIDGNSVIFDLIDMGLITRGSLPSIGVNMVGNPSDIKHSIYGYYNNVNGGVYDSYAPANTAGYFIRLYVSIGLCITIFFVTYGETAIYILKEGEQTPIKLQ